MPPVIDETKCVGCGYCASICPMRVFEPAARAGEIPGVRYPEECWHCLACELDCRQKAIKVRLPLPLMMPHVDAATLRSAPCARAVAARPGLDCPRRGHPAQPNNAGGGHA